MNLLHIRWLGAISSTFNGNVSFDAGQTRSAGRSNELNFKINKRAGRKMLVGTNEIQRQCLLASLHKSIPSSSSLVVAAMIEQATSSSGANLIPLAADCFRSAPASFNSIWPRIHPAVRKSAQRRQALCLLPDAKPTDERKIAPRQKYDESLNRPGGLLLLPCRHCRPGGLINKSISKLRLGLSNGKLVAETDRISLAKVAQRLSLVSAR